MCCHDKLWKLMWHALNHSLTLAQYYLSLCCHSRRLDQKAPSTICSKHSLPNQYSCLMWEVDHASGSNVAPHAHSVLRCLILWGINQWLTHCLGQWIELEKNIVKLLPVLQYLEQFSQFDLPAVNLCFPNMNVSLAITFCYHRPLNEH